MKKKLAILLCAALMTGTLAGCDGSNQGNETRTDLQTAMDTDQNTEISIWHDGDEAIMQVIQDKVNEELSSDNITVSFEKKTGLTDQIKLYGSDAENGPDMYMYAHDSLGTFVEMGVLSPITDVVSEEVYQDMLPMTLEAGSIRAISTFCRSIMKLFFSCITKISGKVKSQQRQMNSTST